MRPIGECDPPERGFNSGDMPMELDLRGPSICPAPHQQRLGWTQHFNLGRVGLINTAWLVNDPGPPDFGAILRSTRWFPAMMVQHPKLLDTFSDPDFSS